jgi:nucleotide-binding universal stress UspA family protein
MASEMTQVMERQAAAKDAQSGVRTILLHVQDDKSVQGRLETALGLARACEAHLSCVHVTPIEAYVAFDSFGGVFVMNDVIKALDEEEENLRTKVEAELSREDASWDYSQATGNVAAQLVGRAALADLLVAGRQPHSSDFDTPVIGLLGDLLHRSRTPLFIPGNAAAPPDVTTSALIAWDGSYEAANAVRAAVGLLKVASEVRLVQIRETGKDDSLPSTSVLRYLSRHGIHAELESDPTEARGEGVADILLGHAERTGAAYMVMGGYSHSRVGQFLFGGVTRRLLTDCPVALLLAR